MRSARTPGPKPKNKRSKNEEEEDLTKDMEDPPAETNITEVVLPKGCESASFRGRAYDEWVFHTDLGYSIWDNSAQ